MSRAFVAFYMGNYQKKTQHLETLQHGAYFLLLQHCWVHGSIPLEPTSRAAIARLTLPAWKKIAPVIDRFFDADGRNKRATKEIEKAERVSLKRAMAGQKGGFSSGISKSVARGQQLRSKEEANARELLKQPGKQKPGNSEALKNSKLESSLVAAREVVEKIELSRGSLATALPTGALREPLGSVHVESGLVETLERTAASIRAGNPPGRPYWVHYDTPEWRAHEHWRHSRAWKPLVVIKRTVDGTEQDGQWCEQLIPPGYDEATGEKLPPARSEEDAA